MTLIQPYIDYDILVWEKASSSICHKLCLYIKRAIQSINNDGYNNHTNRLFKICAIFELSDMYQYQLCLFVDDFISKKLPHSFDDVLFHLDSDVQNNCVTKQSSHMNVP